MGRRGGGGTEVGTPRLWAHTRAAATHNHCCGHGLWAHKGCGHTQGLWARAAGTRVGGARIRVQSAWINPPKRESDALWVRGQLVREHASRTVCDCGRQRHGLLSRASPPGRGFVILALTHFILGNAALLQRLVHRQATRPRRKVRLALARRQPRAQVDEMATCAHTSRMRQRALASRGGMEGMH